MAKNSGSSFYYFEHRAGSRNDLKLLKLDELLGKNNGYALFFKSLEVMLELEKPYLRYDSSLIAKAMSISPKEYRAFLDACLEVGLFQIDQDGNIYSPAFEKWLEKKKSIAERGKKGGKATQAKRNPEKKAETAQETQNQKISQNKENIAEIVAYWNETAKKFRCRKVTSDIENAILKRLKEYTIDEIKQAIKNYQLILQNPKAFFKYTWNLQEFMSRKNALPVFYGDTDEIMKKYGCYGKNSEPPVF